MFESEWPEKTVLREWAAFVGTIIWIKIFDWFRIFDATSFYIKLIMMTIADIMPFFFIFPVFLMTFGTALLILSTDRGDDNMIIDNYVGNWVVNGLINQYLLSLGEFNIANFSKGPDKILIYTCFFLATFLTQVTALNMIIEQNVTDYMGYAF